MYDLCVCFVASLNSSGRKTAKMFIFRLKMTLMFCFKLTFSVLIGERLCILHCKPMHFYDWKQYIPLLAFQCLEIGYGEVCKKSYQLFFVFSNES